MIVRMISKCLVIRLFLGFVGGLGLMIGKVGGFGWFDEVGLIGSSGFGLFGVVCSIGVVGVVVESSSSDGRFLVSVFSAQWSRILFIMEVKCFI